MKRSSLAVAALAATLLVPILVMSGGAQAGAGTTSMNGTRSPPHPEPGASERVDAVRERRPARLPTLSIRPPTHSSSHSRRDGAPPFRRHRETWIERLGADPTIPSLSGAARNGNLYATGGALGGR